jgi:predicted phosphodiesterase
MWLLAGDSHGNYQYMLLALAIAKHVDAEGVIQLGDYGFWPKSDFVDTMADVAKENDLSLWVINGNHDSPDEYAKYTTTDPQPNTFCHLANSSVIQIDGKRIGIMGGGVSIDYHSRVKYVSWWPEELVTDEQVKLAIDNGEVDCWLTHDCPYLPPGMTKFNFREPVYAWILQQNLRMKDIYHALKPKLHVHGHMHHTYDLEGHYGMIHGLSYEDWSSIVAVDFNTLQINRDFLSYDDKKEILTNLKAMLGME